MRSSTKKSGEQPDHNESSGLMQPSDQAPDLDLPDSPAFVSQRRKMSLQEMLPLLEEYRRCFPVTDAEREQRLKRKCKEEFVLGEEPPGK